jgi:hypothetical protein
MTRKSVSERSAPLLSRRALMQALTALPALALFHSVARPPTRPAAEGVVEINGWILKRSDVA